MDYQTLTEGVSQIAVIKKETSSELNHVTGTALIQATFVRSRVICLDVSTSEDTWSCDAPWLGALA